MILYSQSFQHHLWKSLFFPLCFALVPWSEISRPHESGSISGGYCFLCVLAVTKRISLGRAPSPDAVPPLGKVTWCLFVFSLLFCPRGLRRRSLTLPTCWACPTQWCGSSRSGLSRTSTLWLAGCCWPVWSCSSWCSTWHEPAILSGWTAFPRPASVCAWKREGDPEATFWNVCLSELWRHLGVIVF